MGLGILQKPIKFEYRKIFGQSRETVIFFIDLVLKNKNGKINNKNKTAIYIPPEWL